MANENEFGRYLTELQQVKLPRWSDLPQFDLYLDQVVKVVNDYIAPLPIDSITPGMINYYVKQGAVKPATKKKYHKEQLAEILTITLLKAVFSVEDITNGTRYLLLEQTSSRAYDLFILTFLEAVHQANTDFTVDFVISKVNKEDSANKDAMVQLACNAVIQKFLVERMVAITTGKLNEGKPEKNKK